MADEQELQEKFWKALKSDMTVMLGLSGVDESHTRPMTAQLDGDQGPIWFFTSKESELVSQLSGSHRAIATFSSKGHDVLPQSMATLRLTTIPRSSTACGTGLWRLGTKRARTTPNSSF
jgi:general stress protein 26